jgi:hypothetical protein
MKKSRAMNEWNKKNGRPVLSFSTKAHKNAFQGNSELKQENHLAI